MKTEFKFNDGGRALSGRKGKTGDCVTRAIANATGLPYAEIYDKLAEGNANQRLSKRQKNKRPKSASNGVNVDRKWFKDYMKDLGFIWTPTMHIGEGCKVHLKASELPKGRLVISLSKHYTAMIDGVINDIYDPSRDGTRCVYGYWKLEEKYVDEDNLKKGQELEYLGYTIKNCSNNDGIVLLSPEDSHCGNFGNNVALAKRYALLNYMVTHKELQPTAVSRLDKSIGGGYWGDYSRLKECVKKDGLEFPEDIEMTTDLNRKIDLTNIKDPKVPIELFDRMIYELEHTVQLLQTSIDARLVGQELARIENIKSLLADIEARS